MSTAAARELGHAPLVERIRSEIAATGPITFARFMELALYEPGLGYYRRSDDRATRAGDFLSAPETDAIFGRALAVAIEEIWQRLDRPDAFVLRDVGAGTGALGSSVLAGLREARSPLWEAIRYEPVESGAERTDAVRHRVASAGFGERLRAGAGPFAGVAVANEVLDALPVRRLEGGDDGVREVRVDWSGDAFADRPVPASDPGLVDPLETSGVRLSPGVRTEVALGLGALIAEASADLERGALLLIDYGADRAELVRRMPEGTVRRYRSHRVDVDLYREVGESDLTAHVAWDDVERAAATTGLTPLARTTQAALLAGCDIGELLYALRTARGAGSDAFLTARSAVMRFIDPGAMGPFVVGLYGRGMDAGRPLSTFSYRLP